MVTDPASHWSPSEIDDPDASRASYPPDTDLCARCGALDLDHDCDPAAELRRLRARVALLEAVADAARSERNARMAWIATLPAGAPPPSDVLLACEHATAEALRRAT